MNTRRPIPKLLLSIAVAAVVSLVSSAQANEIAAFAKFHKDKTNKYDDKINEYVIVFVGFTDDEAFDIYKQLPENEKATVVFVRDFFGTAQPKTVVVGHNGLRIADVAANYIDGIKKATTPATAAATTPVYQPQVFQSFPQYGSPYQFGGSSCPSGNCPNQRSR